jgi:hypothetical protein
MCTTEGTLALADVDFSWIGIGLQFDGYRAAMAGALVDGHSQSFPKST